MAKPGRLEGNAHRRHSIADITAVGTGPVCRRSKAYLRPVALKRSDTSNFKGLGSRHVTQCSMMYCCEVAMCRRGWVGTTDRDPDTRIMILASIRLKSFWRKDRHLREYLLEFRFPHYSGIGENLAWRNRPPSAINQPPSFKVGEANSVSIEHSEFDAHGNDLVGRLVRSTFFWSPGLSFMWPSSICANDLACRCPRCLRLSLPFPVRMSRCGCRSRRFFSAVLLRSPDFGRPTSDLSGLRVWAASVGVSTFCLAGFCFAVGIAGSCAARRCSGCGEVSDSWAGAFRSGSGVGSGTALNPNSRLWTSSAWAENSLNCFHQKLACNFAISNGSLALAKLLARSRPAFQIPLGDANDLAVYRLSALVRRVKKLFKEMHRRFVLVPLIVCSHSTQQIHRCYPICYPHAVRLPSIASALHRQVIEFASLRMVPSGAFEPPTRGFSVNRQPRRTRSTPHTPSLQAVA